jgi:hypothetical protein
MASPGTPRARKAADGGGGGGGGFSGMFDAGGAGSSAGGAAGSSSSTRDMAQGFLASYGARLGGAPGTALPAGGATLARPALLGGALPGMATPTRSASYGGGGGGGQALPGQQVRAPADAAAFASALAGIGSLAVGGGMRDSPAAGVPASLGMLVGGPARGPRPPAPAAGPHGGGR